MQQIPELNETLQMEMHPPFWHSSTSKHQAIVFLELFYEPKCSLGHELVLPDHGGKENPLTAGEGKNMPVKKLREPKFLSFERLH